MIDICSLGNKKLFKINLYLFAALSDVATHPVTFLITGVRYGALKVPALAVGRHCSDTGSGSCLQR